MARQNEPPKSNGRGRGRPPSTPPVEEPVKAKETGREMFTRIAEYRVNKLLAMITTLGKLSSGKSKYDYDDEDIERIRITLIEAIEDAATRLRRDPLSKAGFSFDRGVKDGPRA